MNEFVFFPCCKSLVHIAGRRGGGGDRGWGQKRESGDREGKEKKRIGEGAERNIS